MPVLSQDRLNTTVSVCTYGDATTWSVANLTDDPRTAIVILSCAPLTVSLKYCNQVSITLIIYTVRVNGNGNDFISIKQ